MSQRQTIDAEAVAAEDATLFDSGPPSVQRETSLRRWKGQLAGTLSGALLPVVKRVAPSYIGGETIDDALCVAGHLAADGFATTLGYWDTGRETARDVADIYLQAISRLPAQALDSYVSIKPPPLRFSPLLAEELAEAAVRNNVRLHFDAHGPEAADRANAMLESMLGRLGGQRLGTTLPGRWARSLRDADWAIEHGLGVRVVKGQWPDPEDPKRAMADGFLEVITRLAGRARHVAVATHDLSVAREAVGRLRTSGTSCELEVLLGMPTAALREWARVDGVAMRTYVPYGSGFIPNALGVLKRNPRLLLAVAKERLAAAGASLGPTRPAKP